MGKGLKPAPTRRLPLSVIRALAAEGNLPEIGEVLWLCDELSRLQSRAAAQTMFSWPSLHSPDIQCQICIPNDEGTEDLDYAIRVMTLLRDAKARSSATP